MQQYYTLEEAARVLQITPDELREMAKKKQIRAFQDRGSWRFRSQDIDEMARTRGLSSDPELQLGEATKSGPRPKPAAPLLPPDIDLDDEVPIGREKPSDRAGPISGSRSGSRSPAPRATGDSDVRLVLDDDLNFPIDLDSDVKVTSSGPKSPGRRSKVVPGDSGVRLSSPDSPSDSDVKMVPDPRSSGGPRSGSKVQSDSDIRLQDLPSKSGRRKGGEANIITEEIDLDAEEARMRSQAPPGRPKVTQTAKGPLLPTSSPFELSESDFDLAPGERDLGSGEIPFDDSMSRKDLGSGEIPLLTGDEEVSLGSEISGPNAGNSGINLQGPMDSGISLEQGGSDELEFELSLDAGSTPAPRSRQPIEEDSSSEFELSLDDSPAEGSDSEFELSLDDEGLEKGPSVEGPDSEFELTLDDEGGLSIEEDGKDIFEETNFDVPALDDDSGSEAVALDEGDTDLEGSDFEISLDEDLSTEDAGDSQVVEIEDEEEADDAAATVAKPRKGAVRNKFADVEEDEPIMEEEDEEGLDLGLESGPRRKKGRKAAEEDEYEEEEDEVVGVGTQVAAPPAEWGPLPAILLFPTVIVMFVVGLMGFELVQSMFAYHRPAKVGKPIIDTIARQFDDSLPPD